MLRRGLTDRDLAVCDPQALHETEGVLVRAVGCSETRHRNAHYARTVVAQLIRREHAYKKRECAIESSGYTDLERLGVRVFPTTHKGAGLDREDIHAISIFFALCR